MYCRDPCPLAGAGGGAEEVMPCEREERLLNSIALFRKKTRGGRAMMKQTKQQLTTEEV